MPDISAGSKPIAFGDFSYYWVVCKKPVTVRTLKEKFVTLDQIGYLAFEFLDGKLIRPDAVKVIQMETFPKLKANGVSKKGQSQKNYSSISC